MSMTRIFEATGRQGRMVRLAAVLLLFTGAAALRAQDRIELLDRIVAVVNTDVITQSELERERRIAIATLRKQGTALPQRELLDKQLLERMITKNLLVQQARQTGLRASDADLENALQRIAA
jgi:peptidyl-prolyl cis-trans isomerase SurA